MFKIDWATAIGGAAVGYLVKGKVEDTKSKFRGIYTGAVNSIKEAFSEADDSQSQIPQASQNGKNTNGQNG